MEHDIGGPHRQRTSRTDRASTATLDLRILKYFNIKPHGKLDLVVEAFNLLNRTNVSQINAVYGPLLTARPSFGRPIEAGIARQIQFSVDFEF